jgi:hypothetical protein
MTLPNRQAPVHFSPFSALLRDGFDRMQEFVESEEFTFVVNGENFSMPLTEALLLSFTVCEIVRNDASCRSFRIDTGDMRSGEFGEFLSFIRRSRVANIGIESGQTFLSFCRVLGNDSLSLLLLSVLHPIVSDSSPSIDSGLRGIPFYEVDVDFCASRFYLYSVKELRMLDHSLLHRILASPSLTIRTEDAFLRLILDLGDDFREFFNYVEICHLSASGISNFVDRVGFENLTSMIWSKVSHRLKGVVSETVASQRFISPFQSRILENCPSALDEFVNRQWTLIYRGSDHGFGASNFHSKCDGIGNTVTVILTTTGCIFGGFTPVAWESTGGYKPDSTSQSFLFRIKDGRNSAPCKFPLSKPSQAIHYHASYGARFGSGADIGVADRCNQNNNSYTILGGSYVNGTGIDGTQVFAGERNFTVKEVEVFRITE